MNGKGDGRRPAQVDRKSFDEAWARVFGQREKTRVQIADTYGIPGPPDTEWVFIQFESGSP